MNTMNTLTFFFLLYASCGYALSLDGEEIEELVDAHCSHMNHDNNQTNAYFRRVDKKVCCMCPVGTFWAGHCNSNANSTVCNPCPDNTYIDFEPHLRRTCERQTEFCLPPMKLAEGSPSKEARCVCPEGKKLTANARGCVPDDKTTTWASFTRKITQSTVPSLDTTKSPTTSSFSPPTTQGTVKSPTTMEMTLSQETTVSTTRPSEKVVLSDPPEDIKTNDNEDSKQGVPGGDNVAIIVIAVFGVLALFGLVIFVIWYKRRTSQDGTPKPPPSNSSTPTTSRSTLLRNTNRSSTEEDVHYQNEQVPQENGTVPIRNCQLRAPVQPHPNRVVEAHPLLHPEPPVAEEPQRSVEPAQELQRPAQDPQIPSQEPDPYQNITDFASRIGMKLKDKIPRRDVANIFRRILGTDKEIHIQDMLDKYKDNTSEVVYQLIREAKNAEGRKFTHDFLLKKLRSVTPLPQDLIDNVEDDKRQFCT